MKYTKKDLKKIHVQQLGEYACGLACLSALTKYYGGNVSQERLREISGTTLNGTTLLGLYQAAEQIGFEATGYEADLDNLKDLDHPVILHVIQDEKREHFVVNYGFEKGKFTIGDPGWGIVEYTEDELQAIWQSKTLLSVTPDKTIKTKKSTSQSQFKWFKSLILDDIPILTIAGIMGVVIAILGLSMAVFTQKLIDDFLPNNETEKIFIGTLALAILLIARAFIGYIRGIFMARQGKDLNVRVVKSFIEKIIYLPMTYFKGYSTGDLVARMNDSMRIKNTVSLITGDILINLLVVVVSSIYIFILSVELGLLSLSSMIFFLLAAWYFHPKILESQKEVMVAHSGNETQYIDSISGISSIKSFNKEETFKDRIHSVYNVYQTKGYDLAILGNKYGFVTQLLVAIYISLFFSLGVYYVMSEKLMLGELMAILTMAESIIPSLAGLMVANIQIQEAKVAFNRLYEISSLEKEYDPEMANDLTLQTNSKNVLSIENLVFRFPGRSPLLNNIQFRLVTGETVTLFGEVGSGKSTLVDIIQGFYQTEQGQLRLNGQEMNEWDITEWRSEIGVVSQSEKIFNTTVLDNICLSNDPNEPERCIHFLNRSGFGSYLDNLPQGYLTICGEEGQNLSGGQQQLVTIARALYKEPSFLLLDESTSAIDFDTEREVLSILKNYAKKNQIGLLLITHRISLAKQTDKIYILQNGSIHDSGTHEKLISDDNYYAKGYSFITDQV